jgi:hypothetical protein
MAHSPKLCGGQENEAWLDLGNSRHCYYVCLTCIRQTDDGFTVRPWYGGDSLKWAK